MISIKKFQDFAQLIVNGKVRIGFYPDINNQIYQGSDIVFSNVLSNSSTLSEFPEEDDVDFYHDIKTAPIFEIPNGILLEFIDLLGDDLVPPLEILPYPFNQAIFLKKGNVLLLRFRCFTDWDNWNKRWTANTYFDELINQAKYIQNIKIIEDITSSAEGIGCSIEIEDTTSSTIGEALKNSLPLLGQLITQVDSSLNGLHGFQKILNLWEQNMDNSSESFWQSTFHNYSWVIAQSMSFPVILFKDKAFLGGKGLDNKNGNIVDFIYLNHFSQNIALVEIKTPKTPLVGKRYRGVFSISTELSGAIVQILKYKDVHQKNFYSISRQIKDRYELFNPKCLLVVGLLSSLTEEEREAFELFRSDFRSVEIITFDELFKKIDILLHLTKESIG